MSVTPVAPCVTRRVSDRQRPATALAALGLLLAACAQPAASPPAAGSAPAAAAPAVAAKPAASAAESPAPPPSAMPPTALSAGLLPPAAFQWPSYVAQEKGFLTAQGIDLDVTQIGTPNEAARAAVSGSVAVAHFSADAAVRAIEGGGNLVVVGSEIANPAFSLIVQPEIRDYADLRGKSIAVSTPKDGAAVVLRLMLRARGLGDNDTDFVSVGTTPNRYTALKSRAADGAIMTQPLDFVAMDEGFRLLGRSSEVLKEFMFMSVAANRSWAQENRATLVRYLRGLGAAAEWLYAPANKDEAISIMAERTRTDRSAVERTYGVYIEEGKIVPRHAEVPVAGLEAYLQAMVELEDIPSSSANVSRYYDPSYMQAAKQ